jgi:predicted nucleic acid-binding protein
MDHLRDRNTLFQKALHHFPVAITSITVYELLAVPTLSERQSQLLSQVFSKLSILALNTYAAEKAAGLYRHLSAKGELITLPDILIAGICLANILPLLTRNEEHFKRIPELILYPLDSF